MTDLLNNDLIIYSICTVSVILVTGLIIQYYFINKTIETPNSPPTFNFTSAQLRELDQEFEKGKKLDDETLHKVEEDFSKILGEEDYDKYNQEVQQIQDDFNKELDNIFAEISNSGIDLIEIFYWISDLIDLTNLITQFYLWF
jgi:hypothetical protein